MPKALSLAERGGKQLRLGLYAASFTQLNIRTGYGHVGCDDFSKGMHATKHFVNTGHPVIVALPDKPWKWCYIDKIYG